VDIASLHAQNRSSHPESLAIQPTVGVPFNLEMQIDDLQIQLMAGSDASHKNSKELLKFRFNEIKVGLKAQDRQRTGNFRVSVSVEDILVLD